MACSAERSLATRSLDDEATRTDGDLDDAVDSAAQIPGRLGRYVILDRLGEGAMGVVLSAWDRELDRSVAIKLLRPGRRMLNAGPRLVREAQALARLSHPNVVAVFDASCDPAAAFVAMELVRGCTLRQWLAQEQRSLREILAMFDGAAAGLAAAHAAGIVHRDFKPDNVLVGDDGRPRVADFGLAFGASDDRLPIVVCSESSSSSLDARLTATGLVMGTPAYMAPEQRRGDSAMALSDQYSFCVALWEAVHGARPGEASGDAQQSGSRVASRVPSWLRSVLRRGLSERPRDRWPSMAILRAKLAPPRRRGRLVAAIAVAAAALSSASLVADAGVACPGIDVAWSGDERALVEEAMLSTGVGHARSAWEAVGPRLDAFAEELKVAGADVCTATPAEAPVVTLCLEHRAAAFSAVVDVLASADAPAIDRARSIVGGLPRVAVCRDPEARSRELPVPTDPDGRVVASRIREQLVAATALREARRFDAGLQAARDALELARAIEFDPLIAEAQLVHGSLLELTGADAMAEKELLESVMRASGQRDDHVAAMAMMRLVGVVGYRLARVDEGRQWARHAGAMAERGGLGRADQAQLANNIGAVEFRAGNYAGAETIYRGVVELVASPIDQREQEALAHARNNLGNSLAMQGRFVEARDELTRSTETLATLLGEDHPTVAMAHINLGNAEYDLGDWEAAAERQRLAYEIATASVGPGNPLVAASLANLGAIMHRLGHSEDARRMLEESITLREAVMGPKHPDLAFALNNLGEVYRDLGHPDLALVAHERAAAIWAGHDPNHPTAGYAMANRGLDLLGLGRTSEAVTALRDALALCEATAGDPPRVAAARFGLAQALFAAGEDREGALALAKAARAEYDALGGRYHYERSRIDGWLAEHG